MAPRDQVKATLKKLTNSYRETTKEFTKLKVPAAVIWFNHETNRLEVDGHGPIVQFLLQNLDEIMQRPHFNIFTDEEIQRSQEYAPPSKPLNDMTTKELKQYAVGLMIHLLGKKHKFSNPENKPYWWPADEPWQNLQSGGASRYRKIICAYFLAERGTNLATICGTCKNQCTTCKPQQAPPTVTQSTPVSHDPASSSMIPIETDSSSSGLTLSESTPTVTPSTPVSHDPGILEAPLEPTSSGSTPTESTPTAPLEPGPSSMITHSPGGTETQLTVLEPADHRVPGVSNVNNAVQVRTPIPTPRLTRSKRKPTEDPEPEPLSSAVEEPKGLQLFIQLGQARKARRKL